MKRDENENLVLNNEMRMNDMKNEALHLIMMMVKHCKKNKQSNLFIKKNKKIKTSVFFPSRLPSSDLVHVTFPEIEIKRQLRENFLLTRTAFWDSELQTIIYTDLSLSARINCLTCLSLSLRALLSSSSFFLTSSSSFSTLLRSALLKI